MDADGLDVRETDGTVGRIPSRTRVWAAGVAASPLGRQLLAGRATDEPFRYRDKGRMAVIARNQAVATIGGREVSGYLAWLAWLVVHLQYQMASGPGSPRPSAGS